MSNKIAVVGVGKLGLCFALNLESAGFEVWGIETNETYARALKEKTFNSDEPQVNELLRSASNFHVSSSITTIAQQNISDIFIMVSTPSLADGGYNHSQIEHVAERLTALGIEQNEIEQSEIPITIGTRNSQLATYI